MANISAGKSSHHRETSDTGTTTDVKANNIIDTVTNRMIDPFFYLQHSEVINIANGITASSQDILLAKGLGVSAMEEAEANKCDKIKITKVSTFETQQQTNKQKSKPVAK